MAARNSGLRAASQAWTAALVRPSTCPNRACSPVRSTNPVSHGSVRRHRTRPSSCCPSGSHRGRPYRVGSRPSPPPEPAAARPARPRPVPPPRAAPSATTPHARQRPRTGPGRPPPPPPAPTAAGSSCVSRPAPGDLLGKRLPRARPDPTAPAPLAPLHHRELTAARQVARPGQHPALARGRHHRARRAPRRVRIIGHQLHDLHTDAGTHDTLHRQTPESQQARRIIATVDHGPWLSSRCS